VKSSFSRLYSVVLLLCACFTGFGAKAHSQGIGGAMDAETATPMPGKGHDYQQLLAETVDPSSGQVSFRFDEPVPPSRGFTLPVAYTYNSAYVHLDQGVTGALMFSPTVDSLWNAGSLGSGGWNVPLPKLTMSAWYQLYVHHSAGPGGAGTGSPDGQIDCQYFSNYAFTDKNGSTHNLTLGFSVTGAPIGLFVSTSNCWGGDTISPGDQSGAEGNPVQALDGGDSEFSAYFANPNLAGADQGGYTMIDPSVIVQDRVEGTTYYFDLSGIGQSNTTYSAQQFLPSSITDRNGNTEEMGQFTPGYQGDTAGRDVFMSPFFQITPSTFSVASYSIPMQTINAGGSRCPSYNGSFSNSLSSVTVISQISLPDGFSYQLYYGSNNPTDSSVTNPWGLINEIVYPGGGWVKYLWTTSVAGTYSQMMNYNSMAVTDPALYGSAQCENLYTPPVVAKRIVSNDGVNVAETQTFSYSTTWPAQVSQNPLPQSNWTSKSTSVLTTDNISGLSFLKTYSYLPVPLTPTPYSSSVFASQLPVEQTVTTYSGSTASTTPLDITTKGWFNQYLQACEFHSFSSGMSSGHFLNYQYNTPQPSDDKEYDYGQISNPPSVCFNSNWPTIPYAPSSPIPARETTTTFQLADVYRPCKSVKLNSSGTQIAETDVYYDGGTTLCASGPGNATQSVSGLPTGTHNETLYGPSSTLSRGNITKMARMNAAGTSPVTTTTYTYDETGMPASMTDGCGNPSNTCADMPSGASHTTTFSFSDNPSTGNLAGNSNSYLTSVTHPTVNGVTPQKTFSYYYTTGELASSTDENSQTTTYNYTDPLLRLTDVYGPPSPQNGGAQPHTYTAYVDGPGGSVTTTSPTGVISTAYSDGMGHVTSTVLTDPEGNDTVNTTYDGEGRVQSTSNPYRKTSDSTYGITSYLYDALGRKTTQCQPDNGGTNTALCSPSTSYQSWSYSTGGPIVTSQDENGNQWQRTSDSFGRLTKVMEPNGSSQTPSMETDYSYDALDNLLSVTQNGNGTTNTARVRSFSYDSLSRLIAVSNPETASSANPPSLTCSGASGASWTTCYGYDANGNLASKTDNRGVITSYSYDALNRLYAKSYNTGDPSVFMQYDHPALGASDLNPIGQMTLEWTGPASTAPSSSNSLTSIPSGAYTSTAILSHDPTGRVTSEQQCPLAPCSTAYQFAYSYDLAGDLTQWNNGLLTSVSTTLPGLVWTASYDTAGRINQLLTSTQPWMPSVTYPSELVNLSLTGSIPSYDAFGHVLNEQASIYPTTSGSPGLEMTDAYDNRGRITSEQAVGHAAPQTGATGSFGVIAITGAEQAQGGFAGSGTVTISGSGVETLPIAKAASCAGIFVPNPNGSGPPTTGECYTTGGGAFVLVKISTAPGSQGQMLSTVQCPISFGVASSDFSIASGIASCINASGSTGVSATVTGTGVTVTQTAASPSSYIYTLGGSISTSMPNTFSYSTSGPLVYGPNGTADTGTVQVVLSNVPTASVTWGGSSTPTTLASAIASAINNAQAFVSATPDPNGYSVNLQSTGAGSSDNYPVVVNVTHNANSTLFPEPSFQFVASSTTGGGSGSSGGYSPIYSYSVPTGGYAPNGNLMAHSDTVMGDWAFQYDTLNRLTAAAPAANVPSALANTIGCYGYDAFGNRTLAGLTAADCTGTNSPTASYNANNQVTWTSVNSAASGFAYDAAGDVLNDGKNEYMYDAEGRLCAVAANAYVSPSYTQYIYDAEGARVAKASLTSWPASCGAPGANGFSLTAQYLLGPGGDQVTELNGTGGWVHSNVWAGAHLDATYDPNGLHFHLADPLGSRRVQTNTVGQVENSFQSLPFGDGFASNPTALATADDATEHHFTGKERDAESGNDYFEARYYSSAMGRYMSPDWSAKQDPVPYAKLDNPQTLNLYSYVQNNPLSSFDDDGHATIEVKYNPLALGSNHSFIVITDRDGTQTVFRAGPSVSAGTGWITPATGGSASQSTTPTSSQSDSSNSSSPGAGPTANGNPYGQLIAQQESPTDPNGDNMSTISGSVTVLSNDLPASSYINGLTQFDTGLNQANIPYNPLSKNSNAYVTNALQSIGVPTPKDHPWAPGAGTNLNVTPAPPPPPPPPPPPCSVVGACSLTH